MQQSVQCTYTQNAIAAGTITAPLSGSAPSLPDYAYTAAVPSPRFKRIVTKERAVALLPILHAKRDDARHDWERRSSSLAKNALQAWTAAVLCAKYTASGDLSTATVHFQLCAMRTGMCEGHVLHLQLLDILRALRGFVSCTTIV